jgi:hypothetical protein
MIEVFMIVLPDAFCSRRHAATVLAMVASAVAVA